MSLRAEASATGVSPPSRSDVASVAVFVASIAALAFSVSMVIRLPSPPVTDSGPAIDNNCVGASEIIFVFAGLDESAVDAGAESVREAGRENWLNAVHTTTFPSAYAPRNYAFAPRNCAGKISIVFFTFGCRALVQAVFFCPNR